MDDYISRFVVDTDEKSDDIYFRIPSVWWSRLYEYIWAIKFVSSNDIVLDAACGVCHPFKFLLTQKANKVYACDMDERVFSIEEIRKEIEFFFGTEELNKFDESLINTINFSLEDISLLSYDSGMFDKLFCISVLEHTDDETQLKALKEFSRVIKDDGLIILTVDYPDVDINKLMKYMDEAGLKFYGDHDFTIPENAIKSTYWDRELMCIRMVLCKKD